jgi:hypothetical protein
MCKNLIMFKLVYQEAGLSPRANHRYLTSPLPNDATRRVHITCMVDVTSTTTRRFFAFAMMPPQQKLSSPRRSYSAITLSSLGLSCGEVTLHAEQLCVGAT